MSWWIQRRVRHVIRNARQWGHMAPRVREERDHMVPARNDQCRDKRRSGHVIRWVQR